MYLRGKIISLATFTKTDIDINYIAWLNDKKVTKYSNQRFKKHNTKTCDEYLKCFEDSENLFLKICRLDTQAQVGTMTAYIKPQHGTADIGIMIGDRSVWGTGVGSDAWILLSNWLLQQSYIRKITAGTIKSNLGMVSLMRKSGMHLEATKKLQEVVDNKFEDLVYYARFK